MAYLMKQEQFKKVRDEAFTLVTFDSNGERTMTRGGLNMIRLVEEQIRATAAGLTCKVYKYSDDKKLPRNGCAWKIEEYGPLENAEEYLNFRF